MKKILSAVVLVVGVLSMTPPTLGNGTEVQRSGKDKLSLCTFRPRDPRC